MPAHQLQDLSPATIFVIDDDHAVRDALTVLLETEGYAVATFNSAARFLKTYRHQGPSCLVVEVDLPEMDGSELAGALVARGIELPVVLMSGQLRNRRLERGLPNGVVAILEKPFGDRELLERVAYALDRSPVAAPPSNDSYVGLRK